MSKEAINELLFTDADGNELEIVSFPLALSDDSYCFDVINFKENVAYRHTIKTEEINPEIHTILNAMNKKEKDVE